MKRLFAMLALIGVALTSMAQDKKIKGTLIDKESREAMMMATVQLLKTDSTYAAGALTNENGVFTLTAPKNGKYIVKVSNVGYVTTYKDVEITKSQNVDLGKWQIAQDAVMLKEVVAQAQALKVTVKEDTFVYDASAYRTPEGSVVEELVKKLPGAQIDDDGKITINGKEVKKILVDGKEFMTGDTQTALKNLPTSIINNIKSYDQKSDFSRISGIDDGDEQTVLDFGVKPGMNRGFFGNIDLAGGMGLYTNKDALYSDRIMMSYSQDKWRLMMFDNFNNTGDRGFPGGGGGGRWGQQNGRDSRQMVGLNFNYEDKDKLILDASVRWNHNGNEQNSKTATENFAAQTGAFSNSNKLSWSSEHRLNFRGRIEWTPMESTNLLLRPYLTLTSRNNRSTSFSATFNENPYLWVADPLSDASIKKLIEEEDIVNTREQDQSSYSNNNNYGTTFQFNQRLSDKGRNITFNGSFGYSTSQSKSLSISDLVYYTLANASDDKTQYISRFNLMPTNNWNYSAKLAYSEPLADRLYLQLSYQFQQKYSDSKRSTFNLPYTDENPALAALNASRYKGWEGMPFFANGMYEGYADSDLSKNTEYRNYIHDFELMLRMVRNSYKFNVGALLQPQTSKLHYTGFGKTYDKTRNVTNITPTVDLQYTPNKVTRLRLEYRGTTAQPSMTDLLDITDNSDPQNISMGNPNLKPSFSNNMRLHFNTYIPDHMRSVMTFINYNNTRNAISNAVTYGENGVRTIRPENINGNWNAVWGGMFNTAIDSAGVWNVNNFAMVNYNNYVSKLQNIGQEQMKSTTRSTMLMDRLQASYRKDWFEIAVDGSVNYTRSRNEMQKQSNLDTWQFAYGGSINLYAPWGMSLSSDIHNQCRRGYSDKSMNTNELVWNAQISQSFLKGSPLTLSLQLYDILHSQSTYSRAVSAMQRVDTQDFASINTYAMLKVTYRFNLLGGKKAREQMESQFPGPPPGMGPRTRAGMGRPMGGFGGPR